MRWMALIFCFTWGLLETHTMQKVLFSTQPLSGCNSGLNIVWQGVVKKKQTKTRLLRFISIFMSSVCIDQKQLFFHTPRWSDTLLSGIFFTNSIMTCKIPIYIDIFNIKVIKCMHVYRKTEYWSLWIFFSSQDKTFYHKESWGCQCGAKTGFFQLIGHCGYQYKLDAGVI